MYAEIVKTVATHVKVKIDALKNKALNSVDDYEWAIVEKLLKDAEKKNVFGKRGS